MLQSTPQPGMQGSAEPGRPAIDTPPAPASTGDALSLDRFLGKVPVALCFTASVTSPVTHEVIRGFDEHLADFGRSRVQALVVVPDDATTLDRERAALDGNTPVVADEDGAWRDRFGVLVEERSVTTVLLALDGTVADILVGAAGGVHADEVLELVTVRSLETGGAR
jgi:peroxiredoxin